MKTILFLVLLFVSVLAHAKTVAAPKLDETAMLAKYDMYKLDQAATLLLAAVDAPAPTKNVCYIDGSRALKLSAPLHSLLDSQVDAYIKERAAAKKTLSDGTWDSRCATTCACGLESSILEKVGYAKLAKVDQKSYDVVSKLAMKQSPEATKACLTKTQWVCKSDLLKYVRKAAGKGNAY